MIRYFLQNLPFPYEELAGRYLQSANSQRGVLGKDLAVALLRMFWLLLKNLILLGILRLLKHLLGSVELLFAISLLALTLVSLHDFVDRSVLPGAHFIDYMVLLLKGSEL